MGRVDPVVGQQNPVNRATNLGLFAAIPRGPASGTPEVTLRRPTARASPVRAHVRASAYLSPMRLSRISSSG